MDYRATLTLDYSGRTNGNARARLFKGLEDVGWTYAETSAMYVECGDLEPVLLGLELLARGLDAPGVLSACTLTVQLVEPERPAPGVGTPTNAYASLMRRELPSDRR